jgi:hypothetical protein
VFVLHELILKRFYGRTTSGRNRIPTMVGNFPPMVGIHSTYWFERAGVLGITILFSVGYKMLYKRAIAVPPMVGEFSYHGRNPAYLLLRMFRKRRFSGPQKSFKANTHDRFWRELTFSPGVEIRLMDTRI